MYVVKKEKEGPVDHGFPASSFGRQVAVKAIHWEGTNMQSRLLRKIMSSIWDKFWDIQQEIYIRILALYRSEVLGEGF